MVRIEAQNKYVGGGRESEACFLDIFINESTTAFLEKYNG